MTFLRLIKADFMKTKRTAFRYIVFLVPIVFSIILILYMSVFKRDDIFFIKAYEIYFSIVPLGLPLIVSILIGLNTMMEEECGEFKGLFMVSFSRKTIYFSKVCMIILVTTIDTFVSLLVFLIGIKFLYPLGNINYSLFLMGTFLSILGSLFLYVLYLIISMKFGIGPTIGIGMGGGLLGTILQTGLGDRIWKVVPWALSGRMSIVPIYKFKYFIEFRNMKGIKNIKVLLDNTFKDYILAGSLISIILFLIILFLGMIYFEKFQGKSI